MVRDCLFVGRFPLISQLASISRGHSTIRHPWTRWVAVAALPLPEVTTHVDKVLASCAGSLYALSVLQAHGLDEHSLRTVCNATNINRILYAGPEWWGYAEAADRTRISQFMQRLLGLVCRVQQMRTSTSQSAQLNSNCSTWSNPTNFTSYGHYFPP